MNNRHLYPSEWQRISRQCRENAGWQCEHCGVKQGEVRLSRKGNLYYVTLQACHKDHTTRYNPEAELLCLCCACHWWYDFRHFQLEAERKIARLRMSACLTERMRGNYNLLRPDDSKTGIRVSHVRTVPVRFSYCSLQARLAETCTVNPVHTCEPLVGHKKTPAPDANRYGLFPIVGTIISSNKESITC